MQIHPLPKTRTIRAEIAIPAPSDATAAHGGSECAAHIGLVGALLCPDMVKSGNLLLVWSWDPQGHDIDGFHVYRVDGQSRHLVDTVRTKGDLTLSDVPRSGAGYGNACYAVAAFSGSRESALAAPYCTDGRSAAITTRLKAEHVRGSHLLLNVTGIPTEWRAVGYSYSAVVNTFGDRTYNAISRMGIAFDVSGLRGRRLVSATLRMAIDLPTNGGDNHSCATNVGDGANFWWLNGDWIDGRFGTEIVPTDTGPVVVADVTALVAPWLRGEPNYGFVVKNADENLRAFVTKKCMTIYSPYDYDYTLDLTYY